MAAIALPNEGADINYGGVPIPVQPTYPPSNDVFIASRFERQVYEYQRGIANNVAVAQAARYTNPVLETAQPRTFTARAHPDTNTFLAQWAVQLQRTLNNLQQTVNNLEQRQAKTHALIAKQENTLTAATGPFHEVPFHDGTWPWGAQVAAAGGRPVNLPNLDSEEAVRNLTLNESYGYFVGYYPNTPVPGGRNAFPLRIRAILKAIGKEDIA